MSCGSQVRSDASDHRYKAEVPVLVYTYKVIIDVRNDYETRIGKFKGSVDLCTTTFREFPYWVDDQFRLAQPEDKVKSVGSSGIAETQIEEKEHKMPPRVAMYCIGGIR